MTTHPFAVEGVQMPASVRGRRTEPAVYPLMLRYIDGDDEAFRELHALIEPKLRFFLMNIVREASVVDDLVQVTLLKAHLARERFEVSGDHPDASVWAWYFAIARNAALDHLRTRGRQAAQANVQALPPDDRMGPLGGPEDAETLAQASEAEAEIIERVRAAVTALPPGQREVVELHKLKGMSMAEIAERLRVREGAVRVRAHRAYRALTRLLTARRGDA